MSNAPVNPSALGDVRPPIAASRGGARMVLNPRAALEPRPSDMALPDDLFLRLSLFQPLKQKPSLEKFPGALALRNYQPGEAICRQGEAGWTAFYILTRQDLELLRDYPRRRLDVDAPREQREWEEKLRKATTDKERGAAADALAKVSGELRYLPGLVARLERDVHLPATDVPAEAARVLRPGERAVLTDIPTGAAALGEGQLFGEMSCLYRTPRSATVVAARECYVVEMLRSILDQMLKDPAYREQTAQQYRERTLALLLRQSPLFRMLNPLQVDVVRAEAELVDYEPGSVLCDEHERSDCVFLIRSGIVKVMKHVTALLSVADVADVSRLRAELHAGSEPAGGPRQLLWQRLPDALRGSLAEGSAAPQDIVHSLNEMLRDLVLPAEPALRAFAREQRLGQRVWAKLADPRCQAPGDMQRANRAIIACIFAGLLEEDPGESLFTPGDIRDPKAFLGALHGADKKPGDARRLVGEALPAAVQALIAENRAAPTATALANVLAALNDILNESFLLLRPAFHVLALGEQPASKNIRARVLEFLPRHERWTEFSHQRGVRLLNRLLVGALCPQGLRQFTATPAQVVAYEAQGAVLGEMGLIEDEPRSATLVAYNHPDDDPEREVGPVQVVRIGAELFHRLRRESREFAEGVEAARQAHRAEIRQRAAGAAQFSPAEGHGGDKPRRSLLASPRAQELGLVQGQRLMLIDLDRCTRCDECVQACVHTHDDGRTRLFLDGPRFGKYLIPMTCRSCLDPVCMIGCPVGSIHRGDNRQIVIEDWCIGCGLCAGQCPYDAIQMHDTGIIPSSGYGWRFQLASRLGNVAWHAPGYRDSFWPTGKSPFRSDRLFRESLGVRGPLPAGTVLCFRHDFEVDRAARARPGQFVLELESPAASVNVWLNGSAIEPAETKRGARTFVFADEARAIRLGRNVFAMRVEPTAGQLEVLNVRLDRVERPADDWGLAERATQKAVTARAVVCDLCSGLPGGPACVSSCPHDAAMRVDALSGQS